MDASSRRRRATEEAAEWWVLLQGKVSRAQREDYVDWLRESAVHVAEMLRVAQLHGALAQFERWSSIPTDGEQAESDTVVPLRGVEHPPAELEPDESRPRGSVAEVLSRNLFLTAMAASVVVAAGLATLWLYQVQGQVIQTDRGERREVALADGSVVQVDPETRLRVEYDTHIRHVYLERGRALFHVAKNPRRPFVVHAEDTTVRAVGTAFAVEQGQDDVVVTVAEGQVAVLPAGASVLPAEHESGTNGDSTAPTNEASAMTPRKLPLGTFSKDSAESEADASPDSPGSAVGEILLTADEQIRVEGSGTAEPVREVDSHRALAWAEGRLVFENESVERAVREFNRYNRIRLAVNDSVLAHRTVSGVFSADDPESFVAFIQSVAAVRVIRDDASDISIEAAR